MVTLPGLAPSRPGRPRPRGGAGGVASIDLFIELLYACSAVANARRCGYIARPGVGSGVLVARQGGGPLH